MATLIFQDTFIRTDSGLIGNDWVDSPDVFAIANNRLTTDSGSSSSNYRVVRPAEQAGTDHVVAAIVDTIPDGKTAWLAVRYTSSPQTFYYLQLNRNNIVLRDHDTTNLNSEAWTSTECAYQMSLGVRDDGGTTYVEGRVALATDPDNPVQTVTYNEAANVPSGVPGLLMPGDGVMSYQNFCVHDYSDGVWPVFGTRGGGGRFATAQVYQSGFRAVQIGG